MMCKSLFQMKMNKKTRKEVELIIDRLYIAHADLDIICNKCDMNKEESACLEESLEMLVDCLDRLSGVF